MSGRGRRVTFHGAFKSKEKARQRERRREGAFIKEVSIKGHRRYLVITERRR